MGLYPNLSGKWWPGYNRGGFGGGSGIPSIIRSAFGWWESSSVVRDENNIIESFVDKTGNSRDITQSTLNKRFLSTPDGAVTDGVNDSMQVLFGETLNPPYTIYLFLKINTWPSTTGKLVIDGGANNEMTIALSTTAPEQALLYKKTSGGSFSNTTLVDIYNNKWFIFKLVANASNSFYNAFRNTPTTFEMFNSITGLTLASYGGMLSGFLNETIKEMVIFNSLITKESKDDDDIIEYFVKKYIKPTKRILVVGDSISMKVDNFMMTTPGYYIDNVSQGGAGAVIETTNYNKLFAKNRYDYIFYMLGQNYYATNISTFKNENQALINLINSQKKVNSKLILGTITPSKSSTTWAGKASLWDQIYESCKGLGSYALTGIDLVVDTSDLGDSGQNLLAIYDNGDARHLNDIGVQVLVDKYLTAINSFEQ